MSNGEHESSVICTFCQNRFPTNEHAKLIYAPFSTATFRSKKFVEKKIRRLFSLYQKGSFLRKARSATEAGARTEPSERRRERTQRALKVSFPRALNE